MCRWPSLWSIQGMQPTPRDPSRWTESGNSRGSTGQSWAWVHLNPGWRLTWNVSLAALAGRLLFTGLTFLAGFSGIPKQAGSAGSALGDFWWPILNKGSYSSGGPELRLCFSLPTLRCHWPHPLAWEPNSVPVDSPFCSPSYWNIKKILMVLKRKKHTQCFVKCSGRLPGWKEEA